MPGFFCISRSLFSVFSRKNWRHFAVALHCCPTRACWLVRPWLFKFFSMSPTCLTLNNRSADLFLAPLTSVLPFSEVFSAVFFSAAASGSMISLSKEIAVALAHALHQSGPTFIAAFRAENLTAHFPVWLFPCFQHCFPHLFPVLPWMLPACFLQLQVH